MFKGAWCQSKLYLSACLSRSQVLRFTLDAANAIAGIQMCD